MRDTTPQPKRTPVWQSIASTVRQDIAEGRYTTGDKLPTEAAMAARFGVNRHTVRHALSKLVAEGLIRTRRGAGAFAAATPTDYPIGKRVRFHENLRAAGRAPTKQILSIDPRHRDPSAASANRSRRATFAHIKPERQRRRHPDRAWAHMVCRRPRHAYA